MSSQSPHLGLKVPDGSDPFLRQDFVDNYGILDGAPGVFLCTSTTHPTTWGDNQVGRLICETDTGAVMYFGSDHTFHAVSATDPSTGSTGTTLTSLQNQINGINNQLTHMPLAVQSGRTLSPEPQIAPGTNVSIPIISSLTIPKEGNLVVICQAQVHWAAWNSSTYSQGCTVIAQIGGTNAPVGGIGSDFNGPSWAATAATPQWRTEIASMGQRYFPSATTTSVSILVGANGSSGFQSVGVSNVKCIAFLGVTG